MKKFLLHPLMISTLSIAFVFMLPLVVGNRSVEYLSDGELRRHALGRNILPVPKSYDKLLEVVDTPSNPMSRAKIALGKKLFFDTRLSRDKTLNCASCHILGAGGDDNKPVAIGYHGRANPFHINSPTVLNAALEKSQFWDGRAVDVEEQAGGPVQAPFEMNMTPDEVEKRLNADSALRQEFGKVFGDANITFENVRYAIGAYERTLLTRGTIDRFLEGDDNAISAEAKRGMSLFLEKGCVACHNGMSIGGQQIEKFPLRRYPQEYIGLSLSPKITIKDGPFPFDNKGGFLGRGSRLLFKVPVLRNITKTAPYFHNGMVQEIEEVVRLMSKYQIGNEFTKAQIKDVVEFLKTLEGEIISY